MARPPHMAPQKPQQPATNKERRTRQADAHCNASEASEVNGVQQIPKVAARFRKRAWHDRPCTLAVSVS
eukprot:2649150-Alexandrium_andersonii.AAC.1